MKSNVYLFRVFFWGIVLGITGCNSPTGPSSSPVRAPSRSLSAQEIFAAEGITSIHFIEYDSVVVNGQADSSFQPLDEVYLDQTHEKFIQYDPLNITVIDLNKQIAWNYYYGKVTFPQLPNLEAAYDQDVQAYLGSWLTEPVSFLRSQNLEGNTCGVFQDSAGIEEWIWDKFKLPIQRRRSGLSDVNVFVTATVQKRGIQINTTFPDSIFTPPTSQSAAANTPYHDARHFIDNVLAQWRRH